MRPVELSDRWQLWQLAAVRGAGLPFGLLAAFADPGEGAGPGDGAGPGGDAAARRRSAAAGRALARHEGFLEAVTWQNLPLVRHWLGDYAARCAAAPEPEPVRLSRRDQREASLAALAQRYCAKNETIGFFGSVAWADLAAAEPGLTASGTAGLRSRTVYVEGWAAAGIADAMSADPALAEHVPVRRHPLCTVVDGVRYVPRGRPEPVSGLADQVLAAAGGPASLAALRDRTAPALTALSPAAQCEAFNEAVAQLLGAGLLLQGWAVPICERPERQLARIVATLPPGPATAGWARSLDQYAAAVAAVSAAAGDPAALAGALADLEDLHGRLTARPARQDKHGRFYGRSLVYEDCRRDLDVRIGPDLVDDLRGPLSLLLDSAAWLVAEAGREVAGDLRARHRDLAARSPRVSLADLTLAAADVLSGAPGTAVHRVATDFTERWKELLALRAPEQPLSSAAAGPLAQALFPAPRQLPWRAAVQHSPDLLLRTRGPGLRAQWVLGELHLALNTLENRPFVTQADDRQQLLSATGQDFCGGRIVPVYPRAAPDVTSRTYPPLAMDLPDLYDYWSYAADEGHPAGAASWPATALAVTARDGELHVSPPDGSWERPVLEFYGEFLTALVVNRFAIRPPASHQPRLLIDDVVVARETWRVPAGDLPIPAPGDGSAYRLRELAGWLADLGCPRYLFVKVDTEPKPLLVDQRAPLLLRGLCRAARRQLQQDPGGSVEITEMLPGPGELWLTDADGQSYTSEFRMVCSYQAADRQPVRIGLSPAGPAPPPNRHRP